MSQPDRTPRPTRFSRRRFLRMLGGAAATGAGTYAYGSTIEVNNLTIEHVPITIPTLAARWHNRRIVQLTDLHSGRTANALLQRAFDMALDLNPDFLLITGDWVDSNKSELSSLVNMLKPVARKVEVIGCTGNHDFAHSHEPTFINQVCDALTSAGVRILRNDIYMPAAGPGELAFVGLDDFWFGNSDNSILASAPGDASVIVLAHNPDHYESIEDYRWHLTLCGHTHGGQVCIPFVGPIHVPVTHKNRTAGPYILDPSQPSRTLYVSRGVGHLLKIRLFCPPEITCITLQTA